jgi:hypothetical protein
MTLELRRIPMRRVSALLALLFVSPAFAETLDCALIKSATHPFELTFDWTRTQTGKDPLVVQMRQQVSRKADETVIYEFFSPGKFVRRTLNGTGFPVQVRSAGEVPAAARISTYSTSARTILGSASPLISTRSSKALTARWSPI